MLEISKELNRLKPLDEAALIKSTHGNIDQKTISKVVPLYNQALRNLQTKSDDIAAIELKKALSIWPDFHEAKVLLGLSYIIGKQPELALEQLRPIVDSDHYIARAQHYIDHIETAGVSAVKKSNLAGLQTKQAVNQHKERNVPFHFKHHVRINGLRVNLPRFLTVILLGILIILIAIYIVAFVSERRYKEPSVQDSNTVQNAKMPDTAEKDKVKSTTGSVNAGTPAAENTPAPQPSTAPVPTEAVKTDAVALLDEAEKNLQDGKQEEAVNTLIQLKDNQFDAENQNRYKDLFDKTVPKYAKELYNKGSRYYKSGQYTEAADCLDRSLQYSETGNYVEDALYVAGKAHQELGNKEKAAEYYNKVIALNPTGQYAEWARGKLNKLK